MASSKNPSFNVKVKSISQKKRRKSDLVVMWHSIIDLTVLIISTIHAQLHVLLENARLLIWHDEIHDIRHFLKNYLSEVPDDFSSSWRDGKLLSILLNKLQPGCIPNAENLDHNYALRNMYHAFDTLETKFGISPTVTVEKLVVCMEGSHLELLDILTQLKKETENKSKGPSINVELVETENERQKSCSDSRLCVTKGTGLMIAFVSRAANFIIFSSMITDINLVIEIKGPCETLCRERITKRSPKKKMSTTILEQNKAPFSRSISYTENNNYKTDTYKTADCDKNLIPLEYDIDLDKISVTYTPLVEGQHIISILWYGQHVSDSPYVVNVEPAIAQFSLKQLKPTLNLPDSVEDSTNKERKNGTVTIQRPVEKIERIGKVIKRRVLRHIVKIKCKDIIVDSNDIDHLAPALLKMDYDIQTDPSKSRRNSWGCTGDPERKISAIRQFGIPPQELDAQYMKLQGRSNSLTIYTNQKSLLRRSNSFEGEDVIRRTKLETVSEDLVNCPGHKLHEDLEQDEKEFAYINEDFQIPDVSAESSHENVFDDSTENSNTDDDLQASTTIPTNEEINMLQSLLIDESQKAIRSDLNVAMGGELPQNCLTSASDLSGRQQAKCEAQNSLDIYTAVENELKYNAELLSKDQNKNDNLNWTPKNVSYTIGYEVNETRLKRDNLENLEKIQTISNNLNKKREIDDQRISSNDLNTKFPDLDKCLDVLCDTTFSEPTPQKKPSSMVRSEFLTPANYDSSNEITFPAYKQSKRPLYLRSKKYVKQCCECKKRSKSFIRSEILNRKFNIRDSEKYESNFQFAKMPNLESSSNRYDALTLDEVKTDSNFKSEDENNSFIKLQNNIEVKSPKLKFYELPNKYSFYYYPHSSNNKEVSNEPIHKNDINIIPNGANSLSLFSKEPSNLNVSKHSNRNHFFDNSVHRLHLDSLKEQTSNFELDHPMINLKEASDINDFQEHSLITLEQYNFKQFNPSVEKNRGSLIKNKIKKLEKAVLRDSEKVISKSSSKCSISSENVDVKAKLSFWENLTKNNEEVNKMEDRVSDELSQSEDFVQNIDSMEDENKVKREDAADDFFWPETSLSFKLEDKSKANEDSDSQHDHEDIGTTPDSKSNFRIGRSFSDPVLLDPVIRDSLIYSNDPLGVLGKLNPMSSTDNMSSSGDYLESSVDDGLSSAGAFVSTEDEYIDDEIPGNPLLTHWGDIKLMKNLKTANISKYKEYSQYIDSEILKNKYQSSEICPSECKVFGIGTYYGYVAVKNRFQVLTKGAGNGNLSVSVQGFGKHDVSYVSVKYRNKDVYEVTYQVLRPGLYLISLRWMEKPIVGSPFLCKVTF